VEASSTGATIDWVVVGIGLNVRAPLPPEVADTALSLVDAGAPLAQVEDVASAVLARLGVWYHRLTDSGADAVLDEWRLRSVDWWGHSVEAWSSGRRIVGRALGVDGEGGLVLEMDDGSRATLRSGEARRCRPLS
jgi:BirA family biotin operon repressor/biotin-[acetyl-CoA-carboxylase] ligase